MCMCPDKPTLSAFFDGELAESRQKEVLCHTDSCPICQETLNQFETQHRLLQTEVCSPPAIKESIGGFWQYAHQAQLLRNRIIGGRGQLVISIPMAAVFLGFLLISMFLNILPMLKDPKSPVVVLERPQPSTVISITVPPSELDDLLALIEGTQGMSGEDTHVLPINLPVTPIGEPRIIRVTGTGKSP